MNVKTVYQIEMLHRNIRRDVRHRSSTVYSSHASDGFNVRLHGILRDFSRDLANALGDNLVGIVMGGSYGRGDARCTPACTGHGSGIWSVGQAPRDDIHIVLILRFAQSGIPRRSAAVLQKYTQIIGVPIHIMESVSIESLAQVPHRIHWYELAASHRVLYGPDFLLDEVRKSLGFIGDVPGDITLLPGEARRLLFESGVEALKIYRALGGFGSAETDQRPLLTRYNQALLRLVDALLVAHGTWQFGARSHQALLEEFLNDPSLISPDPEYRKTLLQCCQAASSPDLAHLADSSGLSMADWRKYVQLWLVCAAYLDGLSPQKHRDPRHFGHFWLSRLLRATLLQDSPNPGLPRTISGSLFLVRYGKTRL